MGFILGLIVGVVVGGGLVIVFGKNNKKKVEAARSAIVDAYEKIKDKFDGDEDDAKQAVDKIR
tara:strand:+ start:485207 stop:485395 length:189 start_codon:yes stop_codon:yes gene_type:complete